MDQKTKEQLDLRVSALAKATALVVQKEAEETDLKEQLKETKRDRQDAELKMKRLCKDIMDLKNGVRLLPFNENEDPDHIDGTPALNAVAKLLFKARKEAESGALDEPISGLAEFGFTDKAISQIQEDLNVSTMGALAEKLEDPTWKVKGFGAKKRDALAEAVQKSLAAAKASGKTSKREEPDDRVRECLECGNQREQDVASCTCGSSTFELRDADASADNADAGDEVADPVEQIECTSGAVVNIYATETESGAWQSSWAFEHNGKMAGRCAPDPGSPMLETYDQAIRAAGRGASVKMIELERDDDAQNIREWVSAQTTKQFGGSESAVPEAAAV